MEVTKGGQTSEISYRENQKGESEVRGQVTAYVISEAPIDHLECSDL